MSGPSAGRVTTLRPALRALFCSGQSYWQKFDEIFDAYWLARAMKSATRTSGEPQKAPAGLQNAPSGKRGPADNQNTGKVERGEDSDTSGAGQSKRDGALQTELLAQTDFRHITDPEEPAKAHAIAERLAKTMPTRLTRRMRARRTGRRIDLRRTIHKSIATGGTPLRLVHCKRKDKRLRQLMLLDASGSMSLYSAIFLRFMHGVLDSFREAEAFVFHIRLIHISPALREKNAQRAMERMSIMAQGSTGRRPAAPHQRGAG